MNNFIEAATADYTISTRCLGPVRWVNVPGGTKKLQQLFEVSNFNRWGHAIDAKEEWRDVTGADHVEDLREPGGYRGPTSSGPLNPPSGGSSITLSQSKS